MVDLMAEMLVGSMGLKAVVEMVELMVALKERN